MSIALAVIRIIFKLVLLMIFKKLFFVISVPVHELGHVIAFKIFGCKTRLKVNWLDIAWPLRASGDVTDFDGIGVYEFPNLLNSWEKPVELVIAFSGGLLSSIVMFLLGLLLSIPYNFLWRYPLYIVAIIQIVKAIEETLDHCKIGKDISRLIGTYKDSELPIS